MQRLITPTALILLLAVMVTGLLAACAPVAAPTAAPAADSGAASPPEAAADSPQVTTAIAGTTPLDPADAVAPTQLAIPALALELPVVPMDWTIATVEGERVTRWQIPDDALGWHINSAPAGAVGNTLLSGHQVKGGALLAPLARGEFAVGQELLLTDDAGRTFVYRITRISAPIPVTGADDAQTAEAAAYIAPTETAVLTLLTGWPDFTTTHRIFAQAEFVGQAAE